jgi:hypothetical protein
MGTNLVKHNQYENLGLKGFFGWLRRTVNKVVNIIRPFIPNYVFVALDDFTNGDGQFDFGGVFNSDNENRPFQVTTDLFLTPLDEANLDNWVDNNFLPYITPIFSTLESYKTNKPSVEDFIIFYNEAQMLIAYLTVQSQLDIANGVNGLSINAIKSRNSFLQLQIKTLRETLSEYLVTESLEVSESRVQLSIFTSKYAALGFNSPAEMTILYKEIATLNGAVIDYTDIDQTNTPIEAVSEKDNSLRNLTIAVVAGVIVGKAIN